jgi:hypothetical protein
MRIIDDWLHGIEKWKASHDTNERDLLIEQVFEVPDIGPWKSTAKSLLIMAGEIQTIEFTLKEKEKPNDQETDSDANLASSQN